MTQLGEAISPPDFFSEEKHNEKTCPWHSKKKAPKPDEMEIQAPDEDADSMPANLGEKLGKNLGKKENDEVWLQYKTDQLVKYDVKVKQKRKTKSVQSYSEDEDWEYSYDLQYAPHHLIPGNESLKGSKIVAYLGDDNVIKLYKKGVASKIKDNQTVGYDVNRQENGVWLPSPYALSMKNDWPSLAGIKVVKKRLGERIADETEGFKHAYVAEAIRVSKNRQFHMRHADYSNEVRKVLNKYAEKLRLLAGGDCPEASSSKDKGKFDAPKNLTSRLDVLSANLERLLTGKIWRSPIYTDATLMEEYVKSLKTTKKSEKINKII